MAKCANCESEIKSAPVVVEHDGHTAECCDWFCVQNLATGIAEGQIAWPPVKS